MEHVKRSVTMANACSVKRVSKACGNYCCFSHATSGTTTALQLGSICKFQVHNLMKREVSMGITGALQ